MTDVWEKPIGPGGGAQGGWRGDFPLSRDLPHDILVDCSALRLPIHPMFALRLELFRDWQAREGQSDVTIVEPEEPGAQDVFAALGLSPGAPSGSGVSILPVTRLTEFPDVDAVAERTREILEYDRPDVSVLGAATYMAVAELCGNAIEHGDNSLGAFLAVLRRAEPTPRIQIAIADLGIGIPEHLRQQHPEWHDDTAAIARATEPRVSGTGNPHRGNGFTEVFEAALTTTLHAARIEIHSASGFLRTNVVQETRAYETFPAPHFRRGTWITYELVSV